MRDVRRKRALDVVEAVKDYWLKYNPLFKSYIPQFDESFDRGVPLNLDFYVTRKTRTGGTFEDEMCNILFSTHRNPTGKVYVLDGYVGSGKTSFARYLTFRLLRKKIPTAVAIYVDTWNLFCEAGDEKTTLEGAFLDAAERALTSEIFPLFRKQEQYFRAVLDSLGYTNLTEIEVFQLGRELNVSDVMRFLVEIPEVTHVLIVIDNIDEHSHAFIKEGQSFVLRLASMARQKRAKVTSVLMPLREYTATRFFDIERFAHRMLPTVKEAEVVKAKLQQSRESIASTAKTLRDTVTYTTYITEGKREVRIQTRTITITQDGSCDFLKRLTDYLLSKKEPDVLRLMRLLCAGNLKILVGNMYNLIHSMKLPLMPLFERVFLPKESIEARSHRVLVPYDLSCECLLAIHYPFYDTDASHMLNIFNASSSRAPNDFRNTLTIPRILCLLRIAGGMPYRVMMERLLSLGYQESYVSDSLKKCLHYGIVSTNHGNKIEHLSPETIVSASCATKAYLDGLILEPSYLQYICEDTPMPEEYCVSIGEKYQTEETPGSKTKRFEGVEQLLRFIEKEEEIERKEVVEKNRLDEQAFLNEMSVGKQGRGVWINDLMKREVLPRIS